MVEDRESGYLLSAVNCYFMCQVCLSPSTSWCKTAEHADMRCSYTAYRVNQATAARECSMPAAPSLQFHIALKYTCEML